MEENKLQESIQANTQEKKYLFTNDFVFYSVLTGNLKICRELIELLLEVKVRKIEVIRVPGGNETFRARKGHPSGCVCGGQ